METHATDSALKQQQHLLEREVGLLLEARGVVQLETKKQAYEEFIRYFDESDGGDPRQGEIVRLVFVALTNGGIKLEGEPYPWADSSAEEAIDGYLNELIRYIGGCKHLRWRERPVIECSHRHKDTWTVYSRLAVHT